VDGSRNAARAASIAIAYAKRFGAELIALHVIVIPAQTLAEVEGGIGRFESSEMHEYLASARQKAQSILDEVVTSGEREGVKAIGLLHDKSFSVVETILDQAVANNVDLIIIGTRGLTGFKKLLIGSVSSAVVSHAHCAVLVVR